jgi:hypothetical protein
MKRYKIKIDPEALADIHELGHWYESVQVGLGKRFHKITVSQINSLSKNPQMYAIRYHEIRCMIVRKFPCMVHFYINSETDTVEVLAVISTYRNPDLWKEKTDKRK